MHETLQVGHAVVEETLFVIAERCPGCQVWLSGAVRVRGDSVGPTRASLRRTQYTEHRTTTTFTPERRRDGALFF